MNNMTKILIGAGITVVGIGVTAVYAKKCKEKKYIEANGEAPKKEEGVVERVKTFALKKSIRFLAWIMVHKDEIQAVSMVLGLVGSVFTIINSVKEYTLGKKLHDKLDTINGKLDKVYDELYSFNDALYKAWNANVDNQRNRFNSIMEVLKPISEVTDVA